MPRSRSPPRRRRSRERERDRRDDYRRRSPSPRSRESDGRRRASRDRAEVRRPSSRDRRDHRPTRDRQRSASPRSRRGERDLAVVSTEPIGGPSMPPSGRPSHSPSPEPPSLEPNFKPSGLLAAATKTVQHGDGTSTILKYHEPPEARKPVQGWRLYVFKGEENTDILHIHRQSAYLIGRDRVVSDIPIEHPSCSKQHAVIQYRSVQQRDEFGTSKAVVKPFVIDLESTNGTLVNGETIPTSRYFELKASDVIKFGQSAREYVLLHDDAA